VFLITFVIKTKIVICEMKNKSVIFAAYFGKVYFMIIVCVVFFIATNTALCAAKNRLSLPVVCCTTIVSKCTLPSSGGDSLSYIYTLIFLTQMAKYEKDYSSVNNSTATVTPDCESVTPKLSSSKTITVSEDTFAYLECLYQLDVLYECMYNALELNYGWKTADRIMMDEYADKSGAIRDMINEYMCVSIGFNIDSRKEITEI